MSRTKELLDLLNVPVPDEHRPRTWRSAHPWYRRHVYRADCSREWYLTYSQHLPPYEPFSDDEITELRAAGKIVSAYPGGSAVREAFVVQE